MKNERSWRVKYGFNVSDQAIIDEKDLPRAIYAQIKGMPAQLGNAFIKGSNIISIAPNFHKHTGWYDWYEPTTGDDYAQIKRDCPNYDGVLENYKNKVHELIQNGQDHLIGKIEEFLSLSTNQ